MTLRSLAALALFVPSALLAQPDPGVVRQELREWRRNNDTRIVRELAELLAIPNLARDSVNIRRNARHLAAMLEKRGVSARLLEAPGSPPAVYGELLTPGATRTVVFYAHYDGQPVDTTEWLTPPWQPVLRDGPHSAGGRVIAIPDTPGTMQGEWRMYARSASDDKSPIVAVLAALDALRAARIPLSVNLKFFLEGEEEAGSVHLRDMLTRHRALLRADLWIFGDGPVHQSRGHQAVFGTRGVAGLELTVYGPARGLHSGHYGNWAYNPIALLANLIASMRDDNGRILIAGFHEDVLAPTAAELAAIRSVPQLDDELRNELRVGGTEADGAPLMERIMLPALNLRGVSGGNVGATAQNVISTEARASIDFRLVPRQSPERIRALVEAHARAKGFHVVQAEPTEAERRGHDKIVRMDWRGGYPATRTPLTDPAARALVRAAEIALGRPLFAIPTSGGSLPLNAFQEVLGAPMITLPMVNHDNNQHAANENLRLQNLWDGIELYGGVLVHLGRAWGSVP